VKRVIAGHTLRRGHFLPHPSHDSTHSMVDISSDGADGAEVADLTTRGWFKLLANGVLILMILLQWLLRGLLCLLSDPLRHIGRMRFMRAPLRLLLRFLSRCRGGGGGASAPPPERRRGVSPLNDLLEDLPDFFAAEVLAWLDPTDCAILAQVGRPWLAVVVANNLPCAGKAGAVPLNVDEFVGSVARLAWAKVNGCPWGTRTCSSVARGGRLAVLQWAREHECDWDLMTCARAAEGGYLQMLRWAREHGCPWDERTCALPRRAARAPEGAAVGAGAPLPVARGTRRRVSTPLRGGTWRWCSGRGNTAATVATCVGVPLRAGTCTFCSGCCSTPRGRAVHVEPI